MMNKLSDLPTEILNNIFRKLVEPRTSPTKKNTDDRSDLLQCQLTCQGWKVAAQRSLFFKITLKKETCAIQVLEVAKNIKDCPGNWTRYLYYDFSDPSSPYDMNYQHDTYLEQFATYFPFLEHITTLHQNYAFYTAITHVLKDKKLTRLKTLTISSYKNDIRPYVNCLLALQNSLVEASLCYERRRGGDQHRNDKYSSTQRDRLAKNLIHFTQLKHLKLVNLSTSPVEHLDSILDSCQTLESFTFYIEMINQNDKTTAFIQQDNMKIDWPSIKPHQSIRSLRVNASLNNDNMLFIMRKFPNLQR